MNFYDLNTILKNLRKKIEHGLYFRDEKNIWYNLKIINTIYFKKIKCIICGHPKKMKRMGKKACLWFSFLFSFWFIAQWVLNDVTLCVQVFLGWGVCVCLWKSIFHIFILRDATNHLFCIRCDWSSIFLILFKLPNKLNQFKGVY